MAASKVVFQESRVIKPPKIPSTLEYNDTLLHYTRLKFFLLYFSRRIIIAYDVIRIEFEQISRSLTRKKNVIVFRLSQQTALDRFQT